MRIFRESLIARLVGYFIALTLLTVVLAATVAYWRARDALAQSLYARLEAVTVLKEQELIRWVGDQRQEVVFIAQLPAIQATADVLLREGVAESEYETAYTSLHTLLHALLVQKLNFEEVFILTDVGGQIAISTEPLYEGQYRVREAYFVNGRVATYVQNVHPSPVTGHLALTIATPLLAPDGRQIGVLAVNLNLDRMHAIISERAGLGETGETYLVDSFSNFISEGAAERSFPRANPPLGIQEAVQNKHNGQAHYTNYAGVPVVGDYRWIEELELALLAEIEQQEAFAPARLLAGSIVVAGMLLVLFVGGSGYFVSRQIARPILTMTEAATRIAEGDLNQTVPELTRDELGALARAFNRMTAQLRELYTSLEARVVERTQALQVRSMQLQAASQVAREAATIEDVGQLLDQTVVLISRQFGFYHAGIFLLDEARAYALLRAASSEGGQQMLARGHRLEVGQVGIVGYVSGRGEPRVALDVGEDAVWFNNPDLPDTRSEIGLALKVRGEVIGVLDVQSDQSQAFTQADEEILQTLADQLAVAIDNARLLEELRQNLREMELLYGQRVRERWRKRLMDATPAYHYTATGVTSAAPATVARMIPDPVTQPTLDVETRQIAVPIRLRQELLGSIVLRRAVDESDWSAEDLSLVEEVAEQISLALENARLLDETRRGVEREQLISEIADRMRASTDMNTVLQTTIRELGRVLGATGTIRMGSTPPTEG